MRAVVEVLAQSTVEVLAQASTPTLPPIAPDPAFLPGGEKMVELLGGLMLAGKLACTAAAILGGATWFVASNAGNYAGTAYGRRALWCGLLGAALCSAAPFLVDWFFGVGAAVER